MFYVTHRTVLVCGGEEVAGVVGLHPAQQHHQPPHGPKDYTAHVAQEVRSQLFTCMQIRLTNETAGFWDSWRASVRESYEGFGSACTLHSKRGKFWVLVGEDLTARSCLKRLSHELQLVFFLNGSV
jgi:hypothetical protein